MDDMPQSLMGNATVPTGTSDGLTRLNASENSESGESKSLSPDISATTGSDLPAISKNAVSELTLRLSLLVGALADLVATKKVKVKVSQFPFQLSGRTCTAIKIYLVAVPREGNLKLRDTADGRFEIDIKPSGSEEK